MDVGAALGKKCPTVLDSHKNVRKRRIPQGVENIGSVGQMMPNDPTPSRLLLFKLVFAGRT